MDRERIWELGAQVRFDCRKCGSEVVIELGGPGNEHFWGGGCPNPECDARYWISLEAEAE